LRKRASPLASSIIRTVASPPSTARSATTTTLASSRAKARAVARPMPDPPPVTNATFPSKRPDMLWSPSRERGLEGGCSCPLFVKLAVAVGMPVPRHPPPRSRRAALPHRAPASGCDAQALRGIRMQGRGLGQPVLCEGGPARPWPPVALPAAAQRLTPITHAGVAADGAQAPLARHGIVARVPQQHALQPGPLRR